MSQAEKKLSHGDVIEIIAWAKPIGNKSADEKALDEEKSVLLFCFHMATNLTKEIREKLQLGEHEVVLKLCQERVKHTPECGNYHYFSVIASSALQLNLSELSLEYIEKSLEHSPPVDRIQGLLKVNSCPLCLVSCLCHLTPFCL